MPMSDYIRNLRAMIGSTVLEIPTVSILVFDAQRRALLVRHAEGDDWTTPGGMIEPRETPSDAAVREMWEETGLVVDLTRIIGVFGGDRCASTYRNGDEVSWMSTVFGADVIGGLPAPDGEETLELRYFERGEIDAVRCKPHVRMVVDAGYAASVAGTFQPSTWLPEGFVGSAGRLRAAGTFSITMTPHDETPAEAGDVVSRTALAKRYDGDLLGVAHGEMLSMTTALGSAAYVAIEHVTGSLHGRSGSFALRHSATMRRAMPQLAVDVVPDSGTGDLEGLSGTLSIERVDGAHHYAFDYALSPRPTAGAS